MSDIQFADFLALMMCSDPWPDSVPKDHLEDLADNESRERGYDNWIEAYHGFDRPIENHAFSGSF